MNRRLFRRTAGKHPQSCPTHDNDYSQIAWIRNTQPANRMQRPEQTGRIKADVQWQKPLDIIKKEEGK